MSLHIAILDCDTPVPNVHAKYGKYSSVFISLLQKTFTSTPSLPPLSLSFSVYDAVLGELPNEEELQKIDGIILTGSSASAYDPAPWIQTLTFYIFNLYTTQTSIKIFGSCFGHQLLCNALFSTPDHPVVQRDPSGWELGIHPITLSPAFLKQYGSVTSNTGNEGELRMQFVHADHVLHPVEHQMWQEEGWESIGSSPHCHLQGVWKKGRVLTYQGHAEFDTFINGETLKVFGGGIWEEDFMTRALNQVEGDDDALWAAGVILRFFLETSEESRDGIRVKILSKL